MSENANTEVIRNDEAGRYELHVDGQRVGLVDFVDRGENVVELPHTEVDPSQGGKGYGGILVQGALDDLRSRGAKVIPSCPFVDKFIAKHADYEDIRA